MCYNRNMKRIDVLKGIEQILVQKAYETGHISHRADGDWQKQADGSWIPYKGQSNQSTSKKPDQVTLPNARKLTSDEIQELQQISDINERRKRQSEMLSQPAPAEEYGEITEEDLKESYGDDEVDYTYAKDIDYSQYDDDIKSIEFRENDDGEFEPQDDDYFRVADKIYEQTDRGDMSDEEADQLYDGIVDRVIDRAYELHNNDDDQHEKISEMVQDVWSQNNPATNKKGYEDFGFSEPRTKKQARKLIEDIADRLEQEYPNINDMLKNREHINGDFQREQEETVNNVMEKLGLKNLTDGDYYTRDAVESLYAKIHGHWYDEENSPQSDNADNKHEKYNISGDTRQKIKDLAYKYNAIYDDGDFDTEQTEDIMREVGLDPTDDSQLDAFSDVMYDIGHGVQKSAFRDMRSTPTIKNMGF